VFFSRARADITTMNALLPAAERRAHEQGEREPAAEHLLLAALDLPDGGARRAFADVGVDPDGLAGAVAAVHADALSSVGVVVDAASLESALPDASPPRGAYRSSPGAQQLFQRATAMSKARKQPLTSADVLLAATELEQGALPRAFDRLGVTREQLAAAARDALR
jgi:ATP-dependent Clp protease ATP-binding subunit ClpA